MHISLPNLQPSALPSPLLLQPPAEALAEAAAKLAGLQASPQADMRANVRAVYEGCGVVVRMLSETASSCGAVAVALISDSSDPQLLRSRELALVAEEACTRIIQVWMV